MTIADTIPHYELMITDNNIDEFVLIIGESARTDNMSIYGYSRPTTPELQKQKSRLKLFTQAISGAPYTALAVPLALSADSVLHHDIRNYPDNIINMANQAGFDTRWLSAQSAFRQNGRLWPVSPCGPETEFMSEAMMSYCSHTRLKH